MTSPRPALCLLILVCVLSPALAPIPAEAGDRYGLHAGIAAPLGDLATYWGAGFQVGATGRRSIGSRGGFGAFLEYSFDYRLLTSDAAQAPFHQWVPAFALNFTPGGPDASPWYGGGGLSLNFSQYYDAIEHADWPSTNYFDFWAESPRVGFFLQAGFEPDQAGLPDLFLVRYNASWTTVGFDYKPFGFSLQERYTTFYTGSLEFMTGFEF